MIVLYVVITCVMVLKKAGPAPPGAHIMQFKEHV